MIAERKPAETLEKETVNLESLKAIGVFVWKLSDFTGEWEESVEKITETGREARRTGHPSPTLIVLVKPEYAAARAVKGLTKEGVIVLQENAETEKMLAGLQTQLMAQQQKRAEGTKSTLPFRSVGNNGRSTMRVTWSSVRRSRLRRHRLRFPVSGLPGHPRWFEGAQLKSSVTYLEGAWHGGPGS